MDKTGHVEDIVVIHGSKAAKGLESEKKSTGPCRPNGAFWVLFQL